MIRPHFTTILAQLFQAGSDKILNNENKNLHFPTFFFNVPYLKYFLLYPNLNLTVSCLNILTPSRPVSSLLIFVSTPVASAHMSRSILHLKKGRRLFFTSRHTMWKVVNDNYGQPVKPNRSDNSYIEITQILLLIVKVHTYWFLFSYIKRSRGTFF